MKKLLLVLTLFAALHGCKDKDSSPQFDLSQLNGHWKKGDTHYKLNSLGIVTNTETIQDCIRHEFKENSPFGLPDQEWSEKGDLEISEITQDGNTFNLVGKARYTEKKLKVLGVETTGDPETYPIQFKWDTNIPEELEISGNKYSKQ